MKENMPKDLAAFSFIICAIAIGIGFSTNGGSISGPQGWAAAIGFVLLISAVVASVIWIFSRMILAGKRHNHREEDL